MPPSHPSVLVVGRGPGAACDYDARFTQVDRDFTAGWPELHGRQPAPRRASDGA